MGQRLWAGHLCSALLQDTCKHVEAPKSKAMDYPQTNPSCCKLSPLRCSPPAPGPQQDVPGIHPQPVPRGSLRDPGMVTLLLASLFSVSLFHPLRPGRAVAVQWHSILSQPQLCLQLPIPSTDTVFNDVQIGLGHSDQSGAQHLGEGTWWLFVRGQQLRRREGRLQPGRALPALQTRRN